MAPETPKFLYQNRKYLQLKKCLAQIAKVNKKYDPELIENLVASLKQK